MGKTLNTVDSIVLASLPLCSPCLIIGNYGSKPVISIQMNIRDGAYAMNDEQHST